MRDVDNTWGLEGLMVWRVRASFGGLWAYYVCQCLLGPIRTALFIFVIATGTFSVFSCRLRETVMADDNALNLG